jgi:outer membrane protein TolC
MLCRDSLKKEYRMKTSRVVWAYGVSGILLMAGCSSSPFDRDVGAWGHRDDLRSRRSGLLANYGPATSATSTSAGEGNEVPAGAGAEDYVRLALARNPSIRAAESKVQRLAERIPQVTSLDDPMLQIAPIGEMAETAAGQVGVMTGISQKLPFPGKLATRGRIASQEVAQAATELEQTKLIVVADVRRAYWSYYFAGQAIEVTRQTRELLRQFHEIADTRFRTGQANQADVLRASVELSNLDNELITFDQRQATAAAMLNSLLDRPVRASLPKARPAELLPVELRLESLLAQAAVANPELAKLHHRIEAERQRQKLARLQRYPDLTVSANYNLVDDQGLSMAANGRDQWWIGFSINVPIWFEKYQAAEREAMRGRMEAIADLGAAENRIAFRVQDALVRVETQQRQVQLFRDVIIPQAKQTVDASRAGYQAGRVDFLTLVDNWRRLLNYELLYYQNLSQLEKDLAELEQVVGQAVVRQPSAAAMAPATTQPVLPATKQRSDIHE